MHILGKELSVIVRNRNYIFVVLLLLFLTAGILGFLGRRVTCECGYIKLWQGAVWSSENSQHLTDWYTFSHLIHGFILYWVCTKLFPKVPKGWWLLSVFVIESSWEVFENTNFIINHYRESTLALDYFGDSIVNSISDCIACLIGFWLAYRLPVKISVLLVIAMELVVGFFIRDNLTLNIIMLLHSFPAIKEWQLQLK